MSTINFDLSKMLLDKRLEAVELARETGYNYNSVWAMAKKNRIKTKFLRKMESVFQEDLSAYIIKSVNSVQVN